MQSSRWAPTHRRGASIAPNTNAAILGFKEDESMQNATSAYDILKYGKKAVTVTAASAPAPAPVPAAIPTPAQDSTPMTVSAPSIPVAGFQTANAIPPSFSTAAIRPTSSTPINPQAPVWVPRAVQETLAPSNPMPSIQAPTNPTAAPFVPSFQAYRFQAQEVVATAPTPVAPVAAAQMPVAQPPVTSLPAAPLPVAQPPAASVPAVSVPVVSVPVEQAQTTAAPMPLASATVEHLQQAVAPVHEAPIPEAPVAAAPVAVAPVAVAPVAAAPAPVEQIPEPVPSPAPAPALTPEVSSQPAPEQPAVSEPVPIPAVAADPAPIPEPLAAPAAPAISQDPVPPASGPVTYGYGDPYAQTGGETSDLFFGDDFTPIAQPVPQPVVLPPPPPPPAEPVKSLEPQLQQIDAASKDLPPLHQFQNPRGARDRARGRGRGRGEGRARGEGRGRGRGRGGRGRGRGFDDYVNGELIQRGTNGVEKSSKSISPAADKPQDPLPGSQPKVNGTEAPNPPPNAPTGPSSVPTPAVRGDRLASGGVKKPKLTEEELSAKLAAVRLKNQEREAAHKAAAEDEANFRAQEAKARQEAAVRRKEEARHERELAQEREKNRLRKMKKMGGREWDEGKENAGLMEGTGRTGYGSGFRGRGHYRRGANGGIVGFGGHMRDLPNTNANANVNDGMPANGPDGDAHGSRYVPRDSERGGRFQGERTRGRGEGRGGRGAGRGGRGGRGGARGGGDQGALHINHAEFPSLGGDKTAAARAAVAQASKELKESRRRSSAMDKGAGPGAAANNAAENDAGKQGKQEPAQKYKTERKASLPLGDYASALAAADNNAHGFGLGRGHHSRKPAIDQSRIQSWADAVEEAM